MQDALQSPDLQRELNQEEEFIYTLKYKPRAEDLKQPLENFVRKCMNDQSGIIDPKKVDELLPYLESAPIVDEKTKLED